MKQTNPNNLHPVDHPNSTGIAPQGIRGAQDDGLMPERAGVGFTDIGTGHPGTDSSQFSSQLIQSTWAPDFYGRLAGHMQRASDAIGELSCWLAVY
jgi:hypothetical protein